jgi:hypothetical protein
MIVYTSGARGVDQFHAEVRQCIEVEQLQDIVHTMSLNSLSPSAAHLRAAGHLISLQQNP